MPPSEPPGDVGRHIETTGIDTLETVIDTKSNLKPEVMNTILYSLGLPHDAFKDHNGTIHILLNYRNNVAHGNQKHGFEEGTYNDIETAAYSIMDELVRLVMQALRECSYMKPTDSIST